MASTLAEVASLSPEWIEAWELLDTDLARFEHGGTGPPYPVGGHSGRAARGRPAERTGALGGGQPGRPDRAGSAGGG